MFDNKKVYHDTWIGLLYIKVPYLTYFFISKNAKMISRYPIPVFFLLLSDHVLYYPIKNYYQLKQRAKCQKQRINQIRTTVQENLQKRIENIQKNEQNSIKLRDKIQQKAKDKIQKIKSKKQELLKQRGEATQSQKIDQNKLRLSSSYPQFSFQQKMNLMKQARIKSLNNLKQFLNNKIEQAQQIRTQRKRLIQQQKINNMKQSLGLFMGFGLLRLVINRIFV